MHIVHFVFPTEYFFQFKNFQYLHFLIGMDIENFKLFFFKNGNGNYHRQHIIIIIKAMDFGLFHRHENPFVCVWFVSIFSFAVSDG